MGSPQLDSLTTISNKILVFNEMNHTGPFVHVFDDNVHFRNIYGLDLRMIQASLSYWLQFYRFLTASMSSTASV